MMSEATPRLFLPARQLVTMHFLSRTSADFSLASLRDPRSAIESLGKPDRPDEPVPEIGPRFRKRSHQASLSRARDRYRSRFSQDTSPSAFSRFQVRAISMIAIAES